MIFKNYKSDETISLLGWAGFVEAWEREISVF